jgi:mersacidin/lichenicidin family type 2 lantibiotic
MPTQGHDTEEAMSRKELIIRAWKDPEYRAGLSAEERAALPESPAGPSRAELGDEELGLAVGGGGPGFTSRVRCPRSLDLCVPVTGPGLLRCYVP